MLSFDRNTWNYPAQLNAVVQYTNHNTVEEQDHPK